jgi:hypothetical protein
MSNRTTPIIALLVVIVASTRIVPRLVLRSLTRAPP